MTKQANLTAHRLASRGFTVHVAGDRVRVNICGNLFVMVYVTDNGYAGFTMVNGFESSHFNNFSFVELESHLLGYWN